SAIEFFTGTKARSGIRGPRKGNGRSRAMGESHQFPRKNGTFRGVAKTPFATLIRVPAGSPKLSVLDLATVGEGSSPSEALANSVELIQLAERLGYHRHWVAEHHNMPGIASS